jgi:phage terminase small subunit
MPMTLTPKQEAFCLAYIETGNASEAYRRSYDADKMKPESVNRKAKELLDNGKITARVAGLKSALAERHNVTIDQIRNQLDEDRSFAREMKAPAAAIAATMGKAKLYGLLTDKTEVTGCDGEPIQVEQVKLDAEAFKARVASLAAKLGTSGAT